MSEDNLRSQFFNQAEIQFMLFDKDLNVIDVNEILLKEYHLKREQLVGKNILEISPDAIEKGLYGTYKKVIETGESIVIEENQSHPKYGNRYSRIKTFKVGDGLGATASNITEFKNTIEALEIFSYKSSHDIRGPINNILGITEVALNSTEDENSKSFFSLIQQQAKNLSDFLNELLETIKSQNHDVKISVIDFKKIIVDVKKSLSFIEGYNDIVFKEQIEEISNFSFDQTLVTSVFQNLIENAIKYRKSDGEIHDIKITLSKENSVAKISIEDNGIGISESAQQNIFKMFFRATTQSKGSGLGLYNLRYALEKLGGHLKFESTENVGTIFTAYLPNKG
jgi:signal transduction histidine kinase